MLSQHALQVVPQHALQQVSRPTAKGEVEGDLSGGGGVSAPEGVPAPGGDTPHDGYCCGRYASYWNAFLLLFAF